MMLALAIYAVLATLAAVLFASLRRPHEATRAEWQRAIAENYGLRDAKAILRRRVKHIAREARTWKRIAIACGWEPSEGRDPVVVAKNSDAFLSQDECAEACEKIAAEWKEYAAAADEDGRRDEAAQARAAAACATSCAIVIREGDR